MDNGPHTSTITRYKLGLGVSTLKTNLPSTRYPDHLVVACSLSSSWSYPVPAWSFCSQSIALPLSMLQVHKATEPQFSICSLVVP